MVHCGICHSLFEQDKVKVPVRIDWYVGSGDDEKHVLWHVGMTATCVVHQILDSWCQWFREEAPKQADREALCASGGKECYWCVQEEREVSGCLT